MRRRPKARRDELAAPQADPDPSTDAESTQELLAELRGVSSRLHEIADALAKRHGIPPEKTGV